MTSGASDPTQAGFTPPPGADVVLSASEVEALCFKAARGAGYEWGLAEEAGAAARWLFARGLDGPRMLLDLFDARGDMASCRFEGKLIEPQGKGNLCPVTLGALLSDLAGDGLESFEARSVRMPTILLPFLHQRCRATAADVLLTWSSGTVAITPAGVLAGDLARLTALESANVMIEHTGGASDLRVDLPRRAAIKASIASRLDDYAMRTTVPATASSRADAGSSRDDND